MSQARFQNDVMLVTLGKEHTVLSSSSQSERTLLQLLAKEHPVLVLDFTKTERVDAFFIGTLVSVWRACHQKGGQVILCGLSERLGELLSLCAIDKLFNIQRFPEVAMAALAVTPIIVPTS